MYFTQDFPSKSPPPFVDYSAEETRFKYERPDVHTDLRIKCLENVNRASSHADVDVFTSKALTILLKPFLAYINRK